MDQSTAPRKRRASSTTRLEGAYLCLFFLLTLNAWSADAVSERDRRIAETMLLYQRQSGGWPKNYDSARERDEADRTAILSQKRREDSTFDNGATHSELRHLARVYRQTEDPRYREAFQRGLTFIFQAQYENGGWPQFYPNPRGYHAHITFNDDAMIGVMRLLRAVAQGDEPFSFVEEQQRERCAEAVDMGVQCILRCQIAVEGRKTAWCAQHDEKTLAPRPARSYELASISGSESVGIVGFLMEIDLPSPQVIDAVQSAIRWFDHAKLTGIREIRKPDKSSPKGWDKIVIQDPAAPPLWARFYDIETNQPIFCSRDGVPKRNLAEISYERRNGYSWLSNRPSSLLIKAYPEWQSKWAPGENVLESGR